MKSIVFVKKYKWYLVSVLVFALLAYYFLHAKETDSTPEATFYVVDTVELGEVTSGIQTTGDIIAAQKLDIDVYKQLSRIDAVNVQNGSHVEADTVLLSFDKNDAYVDTQSSRVAVVEAELALQNAKDNTGDINTEIRSLENKIAGYKKTIADSEVDIEDAYIDFLNDGLAIDPHPDRYMGLDDRTEPTLSGRYVSDVEGQYVIEVYGSGAESGYSYRVSGLQTMTGSVIFGKAVDIGTRGLKMTFSNDTKSNDKWIVYVPDTKVATYVELKQDYEEIVANLEKTIRDTKVELGNAEENLANLRQTDTNAYRNLTVEQAQSSLAEARQRLSQNYDVVQERDIVAPFSGTVEGMENVVAGATPVGGAEDTINLGTLISDDFLTTFTLSATDVAKVSVGQKVKVTVTSLTGQPTFEATITQISSLPSSEGVAQYDIQALLNYDRTTSPSILREGMLADIEVVQQEKNDALRIPTSAVKYEQGKAKVSVVDQLTEEQKVQATRMGIVRAENTTIATYEVDVELGIVGQYYAEVTNGLKEGDIIVTSSLAPNANESVVEEARFGPPGGGQRSGGNAPAGSNQNRQTAPATNQ